VRRAASDSHLAAERGTALSASTGREIESSRGEDRSMSGEGSGMRRAWRLSPRARRILLTAHLLVSVGLFGDVAGFLAVSIRAAAADDPEVARASYDILAMFSTVFGIPLSLAALVTGIGLGLGTKWGVLRYPWTTAKLVLIVTVLLMGAFVLGPSVDQMRDGSGGVEGRILLGAIWDLVALGTATVLGVFKPGNARRGRRSRDPAVAST
jgi:hypothetical protein